VVLVVQVLRQQAGNYSTRRQIEGAAVSSGEMVSPSTSTSETGQDEASA